MTHRRRNGRRIALIVMREFRPIFVRRPVRSLFGTDQNKNFFLFINLIVSIHQVFLQYYNNIITIYNNW